MTIFLAKDWRAQHPPSIQVFPTKDDLFLQSAKQFIDFVRSIQATQERCSIIVSGGKTPIEFNTQVVANSTPGQVDWSKVIIFFSDERCVPPEDSASNYRMTHETLLKPLSLPLNNVYRILGETGPFNAAEKYEEEIKTVFNTNDTPSFDLALLGLGADGHTASLFPNSEALKEKNRFVVPGKKGPEGSERVTMTYPLLNASKNIWFIAGGEEKSSILHSVLEGDFTPALFPAQAVFPENGNLSYLLDEGAARQLISINPDVQQ